MRWRLLVQPTWLALTALVLLFAALSFTLLAPWQFGRHDDRQSTNTAIDRSLSASPRPLAEVLPASAAPGPRTEWTPVRITGRYLPDAEVLARLRTVEGKAAFEVLTPLHTTDGQTVLINRGYVRPDERMDAPDYAAPPAEPVTVVARARVDERGAADTDTSSGMPQARIVSSKVAERAHGLDIRPGYFQLVDDQPGVLSALPLPRTDAGPFLSYGFQWVAFGIMAILGWLYFTLRELRPGGALHEAGGRTRRKSVAEQLAEDEDAAVAR